MEKVQATTLGVGAFRCETARPTVPFSTTLQLPWLHELQVDGQQPSVAACGALCEVSCAKMPAASNPQC